MYQTSVFAAWPMTKMVKRLMIINFALWLITVIMARMGQVGLFQEMALTPIMVFPGLHVWQVATYMWFHALGEYTHVLFNLLFLWMFGGTLEQSWGSRGFLRFYLICGVGAGVAVFLVGLLFNPTAATVGASGAIYGLVAAWAIAFPNRMVYIFGIFPIKGRHFALFPIGMALLDFIVGGGGTSHVAHLSGLAIGALLVSGLWRPRRLRNRLRYQMLRRKLKVIEGDEQKGRRSSSGGGYWN